MADEWDEVEDVDRVARKWGREAELVHAVEILSESQSLGGQHVVAVRDACSKRDYDALVMSMVEFFWALAEAGGKKRQGAD